MIGPETEYRVLVGVLAVSSLGIATLAVALDDEGMVWREVGLDADGRIVHRMPSPRHRYGSRGFWDLTPVPADIGTRVTPDWFEELWATKNGDPPALLAPTRPLSDRLRRMFRRR